MDHQISELIQLFRDAYCNGHSKIKEIQDHREDFRRQRGSTKGDAIDDKLHVFFAPGRVNLIGEHTDYNGGLVLPIAISRGIYAVVRYTAKPSDEKAAIRLKSVDMPGEISQWFTHLCSPGGGPLDEHDFSKGWTKYPMGVATYLQREGYSLPGCDILYSSTLPVGAGLSSSAALELVTAYALLWPGLDERSLDPLWLARLCQKVENEFVGVNCGIMDQFAVAMGKMNCAMLLDCSTLDWSYVPADFGDYSLVVMDTGKRRSLGQSLYNLRRQECQKALNLIQTQPKFKGAMNLCSVDVDALSCIADDVLKRRARHVITENLRTIEAARLLKDGDMRGLGRSMVSSHESLKKDYEVTGFELDTIVEDALSAEGCIGARMTGAGFGGCAIALVNSARVHLFAESLASSYETRTGLKPCLFVSKAEDGAGFIWRGF